MQRKGRGQEKVSWEKEKNPYAANWLPIAVDWRCRLGVITCWGRPNHAKCTKEASRFFVSLHVASPGLQPKNRAVCEGCFTSYQFPHYLKVGTIREVTRAEWEATDLECRT